jgi:LytS/YehU family sensor histidine kinase
LNTISSVIYEDVERADRIIAHLSDLLRLTLRNPPSYEVTLEAELELLDRYLEIMRARFEERLVVNVFVAPGTKEALVPQLILQPLVENSIKHAADPSSGAVTIDLCARRENGSLLLEISDQGPGMDSHQHPILNEGVGLSNTAERLSQLYGEQQSLTFANGDRGGLIVRVQFPFHTSQGTG